MTIENHWNQWSNDPKTIENPLMSMARVPTNFNCDGFLKNYWKLQSSPKSLKFSMVKASHCHRYCNCRWDHHHHLPQWPLVTHEAGGTNDQGVAWQGTWWVTPSQVPQLTLTGHMVAHSILTKVVPANRHLKLLHLTLSGFHISSPPPSPPYSRKSYSLVKVWRGVGDGFAGTLLPASCLFSEELNTVTSGLTLVCLASGGAAQYYAVLQGIWSVKQCGDLFYTHHLTPCQVSEHFLRTFFLNKS